jgi:probable HAF family extracellular repeat protein
VITPSHKLISRALALLSASLASAQIMYTVQPLKLVSYGKYNGVVAINNQGQVAGWADLDATDNTRHAFLFSNGQMIDLGSLGGSSGANGLNNNGEVVGTSALTGVVQQTPIHAFDYQGGTMIDLTPDSAGSVASGINDSGQIAGGYWTSSDRSGNYHVFLYQSGTLVDLDAGSTNRSTQAYGINSSGQIFGQAHNFTGRTGRYGFFWSDGVFKSFLNNPIPNNDSNVINAMNDAGKIVGLACCSYPFLYDGPSGALTDLSANTLYAGHGGNAAAINNNSHVVGYLVDSTGALEMGFLFDGANYSYMHSFATNTGNDWAQPSCINLFDQVGGQSFANDGNWHAFVYGNGAMTDLTTLIDPSLKILLRNADHINDLGQITANDQNYIEYLLTPVLSVASAHTGNFAPGQQGAAYSVTVTNAATAPTTTGAITATETLPAGLTLVSMAGDGWTCPSGTTSCNRSDPLSPGSSYPPITVTVNVGGDATSPQVNWVSVSQGSVWLANASDSTVIQVLGHSATTASSATIPYSASSQNVTLTAAVTTTGSIVNGGTVTFTVNGVGNPVSGEVTDGSASATLVVPGGTHAGNYAIGAVYSGTTGIAGSQDTSQTLTLTQAVPKVTWANPPDMISGSALDALELNATANIPGTFVYTPPAGTVMQTGLQPLGVTFNPTDSTDFGAVTTSVVVNVIALPQSGQPQILLTRTLSRDASNNVVVTVTALNVGAQPSGATGYPLVALGDARFLGSPASTYPLSTSNSGQFGNLAPGASGQVTIVFPGAPLASGSIVPLAMAGTWQLELGTCPICAADGGSFGASWRTIVP